MIDRFLHNPSSMPKLDMGNLAERCGLLVPKRHGSFDAAADSGRPFIMRSEHVQEYAGVSGLLNSYPITPETLAEASRFVADDYKLRREQIPLMSALHRKLSGGSEAQLAADLASCSSSAIDQYCHFKDVRKKDFVRQVKYSYWELFGGHNRVVVADNAIPGRYHLFTSCVGDAGRERCNFTLIENGRVLLCQNDKDMDVDEEMTEAGGVDKDFIFDGAAELIQFYEQVRHLPGFDPEHCPIVECQTVNGLNYFLQAHRSRDVEPAQFDLERAPEEGEVEAIFVRGATPPEGMVVEVAHYYPTFGRNFKPVEDEAGAYENHFNVVFSEIMARRRVLQLIASPSMDNVVALADGYHLSKSHLYKPRISVVADLKVSLKKYMAQAQRQIQRTGLAYHTPVRVISDGRRALVKLLEPAE